MQRKFFPLFNPELLCSMLGSSGQRTAAVCG